MVEPFFKKHRIRLSAKEYLDLQKRVFDRDGWRCIMCNSPHNLHMHHVIFRSQQGDDHESNGVTLDWRCHEKLHKDKQFRDEVNEKFKAIINSLAPV